LEGESAVGGWLAATNFLEGSKYITIDRSFAIMWHLHENNKHAVSITVPKAVTETYRHANDRPIEQIAVNRLVPFVNKMQRSIMANQLSSRSYRIRVACLRSKASFTATMQVQQGQGSSSVDQ